MAETKKKLCDLRVIDLRAELEKRGLDKSGVRAVLLKRLTKAIKDEGHDPETYTVAISGTEPKTPSKRTSRSESVIEGEDESPMDVNVEDMVVQDEIAEDDDAELNSKDSEDKEGKSKHEESIPGVEEVKESPKKAPKRENIQETDASDAKRQCLEETEEKELLEENGKKNSENTAEVDDSINLDIGEDELLNDETETSAKTNQDEGSDHTTASCTGDAAPDAGAVLEAIPGDAVDVADADDKEQKTNNEDSKNTSESASPQKDTSDKKDDKDGTQESVEGKPQENSSQASSSARNLWVSGLSGNTRAKDLKQLCSKHGKVIGAKVVTNARTPGSRCYGYVTLASSADAESCIKNLHRTELHGRMISVEKAKSDAAAVAAAAGGGGVGGSSRRPAPYSSRSRRPPHRHEGDKDDKEDKSDPDNGGKDKEKENGGEVKTEVKQEGENGEAKVEGGEGEEDTVKASEGEEGEGGKKEVKKEGAAKSRTSTERKRYSSDRHDKLRDKRAGRRTSPRDVLSFSKIMKERDLQRVRERGRNNREEERRRREAEEALRERERRQRQEKQRLQIEREKLRIERERIEREKNDLLRLERERHKLEREKLELERLELKREQQRLEAVRGRTLKSAHTHTGYAGSSSNSYDRNARERKSGLATLPSLAALPAYERDVRHKRAPPSAQSTSHGGRGYEMRTPSPPRFAADSPAYASRAPHDKDYAPARHLSTASGMKYSANGTSSESRQPMPPGTRAKEQGRGGGGGGGGGGYPAESESSVGRSRSRPTYRESRLASPAKPSSWQPHPPARYDAPAPAAHATHATHTTKDYGDRVSGSSWSKGYTSGRQGASTTGGAWSAGGATVSGGAYDTRYAAPPAYQPPPPGAAPYAQQDSRYAPASRDYRPKY